MKHLNVSPLSKESSVLKLNISGFTRKKNIDYLDRIYFELGNYYLFNNNYDKALENFSISIKKNHRNKKFIIFTSTIY